MRKNLRKLFCDETGRDFATRPEEFTEEFPEEFTEEFTEEFPEEFPEEFILGEIPEEMHNFYEKTHDFQDFSVIFNGFQ